MGYSSGRDEIVSRKLEIAKEVIAQLRRRLSRDLLAAGVFGSVARGSEEAYSDIDLMVVVRKLHRDLPVHLIVDATYCSVNQVTLKGALSKLSKPNAELPQILGGYMKILPIHDPSGLIRRIEKRAASIPSELFRKSAEIALLESFEDFCRAKNAFMKADDTVLKDNVYLVTDSAANIVASLNHVDFVSDREIFKAYKRYPKLPRKFNRIEKLRYGNLKAKSFS